MGSGDDGSELSDVDDEISDDAMDEEPTTSSNTAAPSSQTETKQSADLPPWQPRTQMYQNGSNVVVAAFVPGMNIEQFDIKIDGADLVVRGQKQPTMQDIIAYRRGREQCFGELNFKVALPVDVVHTEGATATYDDGILRVKFVKKQRRPARTQGYRQPMYYRRPMHYRQPKQRNPFSL